MTTDWRFLNPDKIEHSSGFRLQLLAGSWHDPLRLKPLIPPAMNVVEVATLLRRGIKFADEQQANALAESLAE